MNELPTKSQESIWSRPALATGGLLLGITIGSRNPLSFIAGAAAAWSIQSYIAERKKMHTDSAFTAVQDDGVEIAFAPTIPVRHKTPASIEQPDSCTTPAFKAPGIFASLNLMEAMVPEPSVQESAELSESSSTGDQTPETNEISDVTPRAFEPDREVRNWGKAWSERIWIEGQELPAISESAEPKLSVESHETAPALAKPDADFDYVQHQADQNFSQATTAALTEEESVNANSSDEIKEILSPLPGVVVPHLPGQGVLETPSMLLEEFAEPIECEPAPLETTAFLEQPLSPFGDSVSDFMQALQIPKTEDVFSDSTGPWEQPAAPLSSISALHTHEWDSFLDSTPSSASPAKPDEKTDAAVHDYAEESAVGDLSQSPSLSTIELPAEEMHNPFSAPPQTIQMPETTALGIHSLRHEQIDAAAFSVVPKDFESLCSSPFSAGEPGKMETVAKPRSVLADLVSPKHTALPEKRTWVNSPSPTETMPSSRRPVTLRRLVPLAPAS